MFWLTDRILPAAAASSRSCTRLVERERERFLREDALDVRLLKRLADQSGLLVGRKGEVEHLDGRVLDQRFRRVVDGGNAPALGHLRGMLLVREAIATTGKPARRIGRQMALGHDHAGADTADGGASAPDRRIGYEAHSRQACRSCSTMPVPLLRRRGRSPRSSFLAILPPVGRSPRGRTATHPRGQQSAVVGSARPRQRSLR